MLEPFKDKRAIFPRGQQTAFLQEALEKIALPQVAKICKCSERTMRDWRREKFPMQLAALYALCKYRRFPVPSNFKVRSTYAHAKRAGVAGARAVMDKYGRMPFDEKKRKEGWENWWKKKGQFENNPLFQSKPIHIPVDSADLAEFIGIMMGDGGLSPYQAIITLHHIDDLAFSKFVVRLIRKLFKIRPQVYHHPKDSVNDITVSRKSLVDYLHSRGLPMGNKVAQQFDIPGWIKVNRQYAIACVRGLVDTDGSVFTHSYVVNGKRYYYKKLSFSSRSKPLRLSVAKILADLGLHPRLAPHEVRLDSIADMKIYFGTIGTHNPKHLRRYRASSMMVVRKSAANGKPAGC